MTRRFPSLVDLCVEVAIDKIGYLGNVGGTDFHLLGRILPHCTLEQLMHIEHSTKGRDLTPVTDRLWKKFFERQFGAESVDLAVERMEKKKVKFSWRQLYEAKVNAQVKALKDKEERTAARMRERYKIEAAKKQSRQIQLCDDIPPSTSTGKKRSFHGGGPYSCISNTKGNIMKKAKLESLNSREVKNLAAIKNKLVVQRTRCIFSCNIK